MNTPPTDAELPLVKIKGDTITLLAQRAVTPFGVLLYLSAIALPFAVNALFGWYFALWSATIPTALTYAFYRATFTRITFASPFAVVDREQYPIFRIDSFAVRWVPLESDETGLVAVYLLLKEEEPILISEMSGAAQVGPINQLLNRRLTEMRPR